MGRDLSLIHAAGPAATVDGFALANGYGPDPRGGLPSFEEFVARPDDGDWARPPVAVGEAPTGLVVAATLILTHDWALGLSDRKGTAVWATWRATTRSYAFSLCRDAKVVRELQRRDGETTFDEGEVLAQEALLRWNDPRREPDDEADLFALVEQVTGLPPVERWSQAPATVYRPIPAADLGPIKKKKRLFGR